MSKALPQAGNYQARRPAPSITTETQGGALCVYLPVELLQGDVRWSGKAIICIAKSDGTPMTKNIENLRKVFPAWEPGGQMVNDENGNPRGGLFGIDDLPLNEPGVAEFDIVGEIEPYQSDANSDPVDVFKVQWVNPLGGSTSMPEPADRKAIMTKWGSKIKAALYTKPAPAKTATKAAPAAAKPAATPAAKPATSGPPSRKPAGSATSASARTATMEEAWSALRASVPVADKDDTALADEVFYPAQDAIREGAKGELTIQEWGAVLNHLGL